MNFPNLIIGTMRWGIWGANHQAKDVAKLLEQSVELGLNTFDLADIYGDYSTEKLIGDGFKKSSLKREQVQIITKCGIEMPCENRDFEIKSYNYSADYIEKCVEKSLENLQTDYLDLLLLHRPSPLLNPYEVASIFKKLRSEGKVLNFGVSNFSTSQFDLVDDVFPLITNQIEISINHRNALYDGTLDQLMFQKLRPMAWSPLGNYFKEDSEENQRIKIQMKVLCKKYEATEDQILLAWLWKHPSAIIPVIGSSRWQGISSAFEAQNLNLEREDWFKLLIAAQGHEVA